MATSHVLMDAARPLPSEEERAAARYDPTRLGKYPRVVTEDFDSEVPTWAREDLDEISRLRQMIDEADKERPPDEEDPPVENVA